MRAVIQRVSRASVSINHEMHSQIDIGFLILLGIEENDNEDDVKWLAGKVGQMRVFNDADGKMNLSVKDVNGSFLVVSQFTLHAMTAKGNRPSFIKAARPEHAIPLYENFIEELKKYTENPIKSGVFGADMKVELLNDGPVTIIIDSKERL